MKYVRGSGRLPVEKARKILCKNGEQYSDETIEQAMDILELFVEVFYNKFTKGIN